ncbi:MULTISPECIES: acyl-CoA thioesterase [unclassified Synechococcus]|uniref:acyl-CoA thioesterase n=1 Tax=unclassified Synechococcus TaxID=2626047 RepID=UPI00056C8415|nr:MULTISPECIES: acyl-CoA thioesterase [unclassified Synechococcus]WFN60610.1 acyl-CoA thioesterase [Synechococcus sp. CCFWC 502]
MDPSRWLLLHRSVRFGDTDAAGVMHFHQLLRWCHEAYEESLEAFGISAAAIFPTPSWTTPSWPPETRDKGDPSQAKVALPIVHCRADFLAPLVCGDPLAIALAPRRLTSGSFEVSYSFACLDGASRPVARGLTRHVAIDPLSRLRCNLPSAIEGWLVASANGEPSPPSTQG